MTTLFANDAYSTLAAAITTTGQTSVTVQTGHGDRFPVVATPDIAYVTLKSAGGTVEIVKVTARALGSDVLTVVRAQEGTTAVTWSIGDVVSMRLTAASLNRFGTDNWELVSVAGTANAITAVAPAAVTAYTTNHVFRGIALYTNTGPVTINVTPFGGAALGVKSVYKGTGIDLVAGDIQAGMAFMFMYDGTRLQMLRGSVNLDSAQKALTSYLLPSDADKWRGIYRAGFDHAFRNQQWGGPWGGEMLDAATGTLYRTEFATGYIDSNATRALAHTAGATYISQGLKLPETQTVAAVWLKLYKVGNPANNLGVFLYSDTAGSPNSLVTNGTATAQNGKLHTSDTNGAWYRFVLPTPPTLTGGTQYHIVLKSSGVVDGSNYWSWMALSGSPKYPFGYENLGDGTPTWTPQSTIACNFLVELSATAQISQSSGIFDGKMAFGGSGASGTLSMSRGLCSSVPLHELIDLNEFTLRVVGNAFTKDATILDIGYGQDHDRIVLRSAVTTGYATLTVYESDGTVHTVTGSTDVSSGNQDIAIHVRAKADGSDEVELYVAGASQGTPVSSATITFDANFRNLGTMWVGGGFALAPTWSGSSIGINGFSGLPSTLGWTYAGAATEANAYSVSGGKLLQNKNGYTALQDGYYHKTTAGLSNANGWAFNQKYRLASGTNDSSDQQFMVDIYDGAKRHLTIRGEYFCQRWDAGYYNVVQRDNKSVENSDLIIGKGSDVYEFYNNRFVLDGSGAMTMASATNEIDFGDASTTSGCNADAVVSYVKYYTTAWLPPQFTSGSISELAIWAGDRTSILASLYNAGTLVSVKQYCGLPQNYLDKSGKLPVIEQRGVTSAPTATTAAVMSEMEAFVVGETLKTSFNHSAVSSGTDWVQAYVQNDGAQDLASLVEYTPFTATAGASASGQSNVTPYLGLHKVNVSWLNLSGTATQRATKRNMVVEAKV